MNKKYIGILLIFLLAILAVGTVSAANLQNHNFDNYFTMKVPKDVSFQKQNQSIDENGLKQINILYASENIMVMYLDSFAFSENSSTYFLQKTFEGSAPDLTKCYETQDGNMVMLEPTTNDGVHPTIAGVTSGNKTVYVMGTDYDLVRDMAHTIKFK